MLVNWNIYFYVKCDFQAVYAHHPIRTQNSSRQFPFRVGSVTRLRSRDHVLKFHKAYPESYDTARSASILAGHCCRPCHSASSVSVPREFTRQRRGSEIRSKAYSMVTDLCWWLLKSLLLYKFLKCSQILTCYHLFITQMDPKSMPSSINWPRGTKAEHNASSQRCKLMSSIIYMFINRDIERLFFLLTRGDDNIQ